MIRIDLSLLPAGFEKNKRELGFIEIWNDLTGTLSKGNYKYRVVRKRARKKIEGCIIGFPRKRKNAFDLLLLVLKDAYD